MNDGLLQLDRIIKDVWNYKESRPLPYIGYDVPAFVWIEFITFASDREDKHPSQQI